MGKIYVPITGPIETKRAIQRAVRLARVLDLEVVAINVIDQESVAKLQRYKIFIEEESSMFMDGLRKDAEKYLNYARKVGEEVGVRVNSVLLEGDPFSEIYDYLRNDDEEVKLVCVAKKNGENEGVKDMFGSLEKKILTRTQIDVIVAGGEDS